MKRKRHSSTLSRALSLLFYHHLQEAKRAVAGIWFAPLTSLMTIGVIGISLALPATLYVVLKNAQTVSDQWQKGTQITLYLHKGTADTVALSLSERIKSLPEVAAVRYISPEQALEEFSSLSGFSGVMEDLSRNPLPPVLEVTPQPQSRSMAGAKALLAKLMQEADVEQGKLDLQWLERLDGIVNLLRHSNQGIVGLLLLGVLLTVANTLRLNILSRRQEIEVMKLVGATDRFIYRPYLYLGLWYGLIGGLLAWWLCEVLMLWSDSVVDELASLYDSSFHLVGLTAGEGFNLLLLSILLGIGAAWFSVYRHIREIEPS
ncbi:MAG: permease-like cell division protein FtsX [Aeromonadaceae bacterium]